MDYFGIFGLKKEPFSNSPDPDFFYRSRSHGECLNAMEIALRLRRGLNIVLGEVGTGKSTLCRELVRNLAGDPTIETHLLLDPCFATPEEFLRMMVQTLCPGTTNKQDAAATCWQLKEAIKNNLFERGVSQNKNIVLILDEGQKLSLDCLEILRELLNYETNDHKLLQIVIFAQNELEASLQAMPNLADRINSLFCLAPLALNETRAMIRHRLRVAADSFAAPEIFTWPAYLLVHHASQGYPRKIIRLCHKALLAAIVANKPTADYFVVRNVLHTEPPISMRKHAWHPAVLPLTLVLFSLAMGYGLWPTIPEPAMAPRSASIGDARTEEKSTAFTNTQGIPEQLPADVQMSPSPPENKGTETNHHTTTTLPPRNSTMLGQLPMVNDATLSQMIHTI